MLRSILFFGLIGLCIAASVIVVDGTNAYDVVGDLLQAVFGPLSDEEPIAGIGCSALFSAWLLLAVTSIIPGWRIRTRASMIGWPFGQAKGASFLLRTFLLVAAISIALALYNDFDHEFSIVLVLGGYSAFLGMLIYDFRGMLLTGDTSNFESQTSSIATDSSGWILPDTITSDMLGKPELRFELAKDLRRRASNMRRFSFIALAGIGALLVVAGNVILFAGFIANLGVGVTGPERIQQMLNAENLEIANAQQRLKALENQRAREELDFYRETITTRADIRTLDNPSITNENRGKN